MHGYFVICEDLRKTVGEKDVINVDFSDYLANTDPPEELANGAAEVETGIAAVVVTKADVAPDKQSINVAFEVVDRSATVAHILVTGFSTNPNRVARDRAIRITII